MRQILLVPLAIATVGAAPQKRVAAPPMLWNGITYRMPAAAILARNPGASEVDEEIILPTITVDNITYRPKIKIVEEKAYSVWLTPERGTSREVVTSLSIKYGQPIQPWECTDKFGAQECSAAWRGPRGLRVTLTYLGVLGDGAMGVSYKIATGDGL